MEALIGGGIVQGLGGGLMAVLGYAAIRSAAPPSPIPIASLIPLVLATIAISLSAIVPIGWPTIAVVRIGVIFLWFFVIVERRSQNTILPRITYGRGNALKWIYLTVAALSAGVMVENFIPLFGQQLAGLSPVIAGLLGAVLSLAWVLAQLFIVSVSSESGRRRAICLGPSLLTAGLIAYGLLQAEGVDLSMVAPWVVALAVAGDGIGSPGRCSASPL